MNRLKELLSNRRVRAAVTAGAVVILVFLAVFIRNALENQTADSYRVIREEEKTDSVSGYVYTEDGVVRYSSDGAAMLNRKLETSWSSAYSMNHPVAVVRGDEVLIYDRGGTSLILADGKSQKSSFSTQLPILKGCISASGTAAVLLEDGEKTRFVYYSSSGSEIAAGEFSMTSPGYPVDLSLSDDGLRLAVSFITAADGNVSSTVRFYSFSKTGQAKENNLASENAFSGELAHEVHYFGKQRCVVFRENGFSIFKGTEEPKISRNEDFSEDIISAFSGNNYFGFVFQNEEAGSRYLVRVFSADGKKKSEFGIDHSYDRISACDDEVIFSNSTEFGVYSTSGHCRFYGSCAEGSITDVVRMNRKELLLVTDHRLEVIELG